MTPHLHKRKPGGDQELHLKTVNYSEMNSDQTGVPRGARPFLPETNRLRLSIAPSGRMSNRGSFAANGLVKACTVVVQCYPAAFGPPDIQKGWIAVTIYANQTYDEERALYGSRDITVEECRFDGPADGESAFKECYDVRVKNSYFNLRYPFWHVIHLSIDGCEMTPLCRAALWYSEDIQIRNSKLHGIKALRECSGVTIEGSDICSTEFGWSVRGLRMTDSTAESEYFMMRSDHLHFKNVKMKGKYSFQYIEDSVFEDCEFDTKDAFWHAKNVLVKNCLVKGEYLAWYCENVTFENCTLIGTQPLCYCKGLKLIGCRMIDTDLAFERSEVEAEVLTPVESIKNPRTGQITVPAVGEIIMDDPLAMGRVIVTGKE